MNTNEPDKFEQFMGWTRETGETIGNSLQWLTLNVEMIAIASAAPIVVLVALVVIRARRRNPDMPGARRARR